MMNYYAQLKALTEQKLIDCLATNNIHFYDTNGNVVSPSYSYQATNNHSHQTVWLGRIVSVEATYDENGNELTPAVLTDEYHCDVKSTFPLVLTEGVENLFGQISTPKHQII